MSLKSMRKASGMTQREASDFFDVKYRTYQNYENGVTTPDMDTAARFARHFSCTIGDLFDLQDGNGAQLNENERHLIELYRSVDADGKRALVASAEGIYSEYKSRGSR